MPDHLPDIAGVDGRLALAAAALLACLFLALLLALRRQLSAAGDREGVAREELARLAERTLRLADVERDRDARSARLETLQGEFAGLRATLAERDAEAHRLEQELGQTRADLADLRSRSDDERAELRRGESELKVRLGAAGTELRGRAEEIDGLKSELAALRRERDDMRAELHKARVEATELRSRADEERKAAAEKLALLQEARVQLSDQFKALAADILEEKSKSFSEAGRTALGALIDPLRTQLADFKGKVEEVYVNEAKERSALGEQVRQLMGLNQQLSKDAHNLTTALRGEAKARGNWGELILERVLEAAGLVKGVHYVPQESHARDDGSRAQPDIVLNLPGDRFLVIDAKVSLVAYDDFVGSDDDAAREAALRRHLDSVRTHIKELSAKNYQDLHGLKSLDFVILFVPIEPAFLMAITRDGELWQQAWTRNILLVSPSSLLFVVRTVAHLWQKEQQTRNAQDIARRGAELYDKLCGFVDDLDKLGKGLKTAQDAYDRAFSKFARGRGNVIRQAEMLRRLGLKPSKRIDAALVDGAIDPDDVDDGPAQAEALPAPEGEDHTERH